MDFRCHIPYDLRTTMRGHFLLAAFAVTSIGLHADTFDFTQLVGGQFGEVTNPLSLTSTVGGVTGTFSKPSDPFYRFTSAPGVPGFTPGTPLLYAGPPALLRLSFSEDVSNFSIGLLPEWTRPDTLELLVFNAANVQIGTASVNFAGSAGVLSFGGSGIRSVEFRLGSSDQFFFAAPTFDSASSSVPEPGSFAVLFVGLAGAAFARRRKIRV